MTTLETLNKHTQSLNIVPNLVQTELQKFERDISEFRKAKLYHQASMLIRSARAEAAKKVGLKPLSPTNACRAMAGIEKGFTQWHISREFRSHDFEWDINSRHDNGNSFFRERMTPVRFFRYPMITYPFFNNTKRDMLMAPMPALSVPMPKGVLYLTNELKETKIFDFFVAVAPISCFRLYSAHTDPVILAVVRPTDDSENVDTWQTYFVAMWK
jgi:hypothetical protein